MGEEATRYSRRSKRARKRSRRGRGRRTRSRGWSKFITGTVLVVVWAVLLRMAEVENPKSPSLLEIPGEEQTHRYALTWRDFKRTKYAGTIATTRAEREQCSAHRSKMARGAGISWLSVKRRYAADRVDWILKWIWLYANLVDHDTRRLADVYRLFDEIHRRGKPDRVRFAEIIVTAIQHIPYVLVHEWTCAVDRPRSQASEEYHRAGRPCLANTPQGIQSPVEFLYNMKGDCDTRTVLLFTILKHYGYDVAILISQEYQHSVLGIHLPGRGRYFKVHLGKKYYLWETVATGWQPGDISAELRNLRYWHVAFTSS